MSNQNDMQKYLEMDKDELYVLLVPEHLRTQLYSKDGLIARGKTIFNSTFRDVKSKVCAIYSQNSDRTKDTIGLFALVTTGLMEQVDFIGIPVLPFVALLFKVGLRELCE